MKFTLSQRRLALSPHPTRYNQRRIHPNAQRNPTSTDTLTFPQHLTLLLLASASLAAFGQQATPTAAPPQPTAKPAAPIVRIPPKPAQTDSTAPAPPPHLTTSYPVAPAGTVAVPKPDDTAKPTIPKPKPPENPAAALAQLSAGGFNRTLVALDPAHGGGDTGSRINDQIVEKDITLALAFRLRSLLAARGFTVVMTRDSDATDAGTGAPVAALSLDDRAGIANHARPVACLLLHATASGNGVHIYTSELDPTAGEAVPAPWLTAQSAWVGQSQKLANQIGAALGRARIPLVVSRASVRPVDSLTCPALVVELAPDGSDAASLNDAGYQQRVAEALAAALVFWQNQAQPPTRLAPPVPPPTPIVPTTGVTP
jgi:N-acetylmuramoyl-L-alanine amidase